MLSSLLRFGEEMSVKRLGALTERINTLRIPLERLTDAQLRAKTDEFRARIADHESLESLLPEAFAVAREAARRVLSLRPYDVQLMGGAALHFGNIAEMMTGEGKTLASVMPVYLNALSGKGVHVVTVNDYLARRDSEQMGRVYRFLGLEVGLIVADKTPEERRVAYRADITYGTNNELGFDYLRDNMAHTLADTVQRGHNYAIVDEVDSILIDEARTPLIISGPADESSPWYPEFARLAALMKPGKHFDVDVRKRAVGVTEEAVALVEDQLGIDNLYDVANSTLVSHLNNAVKAKALFTCDKDYIVNDDLEVMIVDEFTGRVLFGRRYNAGLHQAIEAKEGVEVKPENQTLATITLQNYFRLYRKLAGMTGTAQTEAAEFYRTYRLGVVTIPANKPMIRVDKPDLVYRSELAKFDAVVADVVKRHATGQPILVGTTSVEKSEYLSRRLAECDVEHCVLNAKHLEEEATIVAQAGRRGAVTVATDMAGRGTDIVLGGNVDFLTDRRLREMGLDPVSTPEEYEVAWRLERPRIKRQAGIEAEEVAELGGLYVIGTERHESRRIDNQLRGRSGRQGDPGETRFYLSLGDELMRRFSGVNLEKLLARFQMSDNEPIRSTVVTRAIRNAQMRIEQQNFEVRKNVLDYDEVLDQQRRVIYTARRRVLKGDDLDPAVLRIIDEVVTAYVDAVTASNQPEEWDLDALWDALRTLYPVGIQEAPATHGKRSVADRRKRLTAAIIADARRAFAVRESEVDAAGGPNTMRELEREVVLNVIDQKWREHLYEMDYLKEGIGLRALAERNPVVEYRREGYEMFVAMIDALKEECVANIFRSQIDPDVVVSQDISDTNQEVDMLADSEA